MPVTININNLTLCHKGSNGITMATIPDVCKTPSPGGPVPIPYPNIAMSSDLVQGTTTVKADGGNMCANKPSMFVKSTGDEAGTVGGVASGVFIKEATWITYSFDVKFEGKNACRLTDKMFHNKQNTVNMAGLLQIYVVDAKLNVLCNVLCDTIKAAEDWKKKNPGKRFNYSKYAKSLGESKYGKALAKFGMKAEKSLLVRVSRSLATKAAKVGRSVLGKRAVAKRLGAGAAKSLLKKGATKLGAKLVPGLNILSTAMDVIDIGKFLYGLVDGSKAINVIPDVAIFDDAGKATEIYDYKFPGDRYRNHQDEIFKEATGKDPKTVSLASCNYCKPKK